MNNYPDTAKARLFNMFQSSKGHPDTALFQSFCREDAHAQRKIYREFFPAVRVMVCNNNGNEEDAKDIFQDALIALCGYCKKEGFLLEVSLKTLLYSIGRYRWLKQLEKRKRRPVTFYDSWEFVDIDATRKQLEILAEKKAEQIRIISKYLGKLEPKAEQTIYLFYFEEKSMEEIAEILGFSNARSAKAQKYKYLAQLRELMKEDGIDLTELF